MSVEGQIIDGLRDEVERERTRAEVLERELDEARRDRNTLVSIVAAMKARALLGADEGWDRAEQAARERDDALSKLGLARDCGATTAGIDCVLDSGCIACLRYAVDLAEAERDAAAESAEQWKRNASAAMDSGAGELAVALAAPQSADINVLREMANAAPVEGRDFERIPEPQK